MSELPTSASKPPEPQAVNLRRLRLTYRDLIASSAAGDNIFRVLSGISPVLRIMQYTLVWTGDDESPIAIRREAAYSGGERAEYTIGVWYRLRKGSPLVTTIRQESVAYYPDATRPYHPIPEFGIDSYKLVIGSTLVSIAFDRQNPLAVRDHQRYSLLDMIAQALLDYSRRQLRHLQEQYVQPIDPENRLSTVEDVDKQVASFMNDDASDEQALMILHKHAMVLENFFGFTHVEYLMSPEIHQVLFGQNQAETASCEGRLYHVVRFAVSLYPGVREFVPQRMVALEIPLVWGANNAEGLFIIRLYAYHQINPHVRRELLLNQALLLGQAELQTLFDKRYRELRIAQDTTHFRRCKHVRSSLRNFDQVRDHLVNSMPEYGSFRRGIFRERVFPRFEAYATGLRQIFVELESDWLEFQEHIRLNDLVEYRYLDIRTPKELLDMLKEALRVNVKLQINSEYPVLAKLSDPLPDAEDQEAFTERVLYFNDAATISVLIPGEVSFPFQRIAEMFSEYLDSIGEGISRLFQNISLMTGIQNRYSLVRRLEHLINQTNYSHLVRLEVSSLDIVSFKIFNELFGHPFGDRVIRLVAQHLDLCSPTMAYHVSGDEYYLIHCWYTEGAEPWIAEFFSNYHIMSEADFRNRRKELEAFAKGQPVAVGLSDVMLEGVAESPLGSYSLVELINNFFTRDSQGAVQLKKYSRTGNDYHNVIWDPQKRIQNLVDLVWQTVQRGQLDIDSDAFASFVLKHSTIGDRIFILPKLTIGTVRFSRENILPYASDIILAADSEAGRNKR